MLPKLREAIDLTYTGLTPELCVTIDEFRDTLKEYRFHTILTEESTESISEYILANGNRQEDIIEFTRVFSACIHLTGLTNKDLEIILGVCEYEHISGTEGVFIPTSYFNALYNRGSGGIANVCTRFNIVLSVFVTLHEFLPPPIEKNNIRK